MSSPGKSPATLGINAMPAVVYFEDDAVARAALEGMQRYPRLAFERLVNGRRDAETLLVTSSGQLLERIFEDVRQPHVRVIALSDAPFGDPRVDGIVYAYLPLGTPLMLLERILDNALEHIHLLSTRREVNERLAGANREIRDLNQIGAALSAEHDMGRLLEMILTKSREITNSDAGSLYIVEETAPDASQPEAAKVLRFKLTQNDSLDVAFQEFTLPISHDSIAGYVALTGEIVNIEDAYNLDQGVSYTINRKFDEESGYHTRSILAVPMRNHKGEIVGVVQLINSKRYWQTKLDSDQKVVAEVVAYSPRQQELVASLASQAAVAFENSRLYDAIRRLFEGLVHASVSAIEARDPTTYGHSFRVANLTVALAEAVDAATTGPFADVHYTRDQLRELRYASLLHDFGKVGVREEVLVKAKKLYPAQLDVIRERFQFVKRSLQAEALRSRIEYLLANGREQYLKSLPAFDSDLTDRLRQLGECLKLIVQSNEPTVLPEGSFERLLDIAAQQFVDFEGCSRSLLTEAEIRLLSIRKGSLDDAERHQIESHVVHSFNFLKQIPWTQEIRNIPEIAHGHHEKLNGRGYPNNLSADDIPLQTRMMTIADMFDALAAGDRPYKRAVTPKRALEILASAVKEGELDAELFRLFVDNRVYEKWKVEPFPH